MEIKLLLLLLVFQLVSFNEAVQLSSYPHCSTDLDNPGFSSTQRGEYLFYSHCKFPNPRAYPLSCGRNAFTSDQHSVCDMRNILPAENAINLDTRLSELEANTSIQCRDESGHIHNITVLVVLMEHIKATNISNTHAICENNCQEVLPELIYDYSTVNLTDAEAQFAVDVFAQKLADKWGADACNTTVVIVYWNRMQKLSTGVAYKLEKTLTWDEIDSIQEEAMKYFVGENNITKGLYYVIDRYEKELLTSAPAYWLLLVNGILLILFFLFMICQYNHYKGGPPTGAFNEGVLDKFLGIFFRVLTGLILVELLLRVMLFLDSHLQIWHVVILVILAVGGFVLLLVLF